MPNRSFPAIVVRSLSKRYGNVAALDDVSFHVAEGTISALLGGNAAGKTTTLAILLGLLLPTSGSVTVFGEDMLRHRYRVLSRMNFSSPYVDLPKRLSVRENLVVYAHFYGVSEIRRRIAEIVGELELEPFIDRPFGALSAGQATRVSLAKALINKPALLLLDEPTASLDPETAEWVRAYLEAYRTRQRATIVLASHNMAEVERLSDDVIMLRAGRIVERGAPPALIARYGRETLEEVFLDIARAGTPRDRLHADRDEAAQ